MGGMLATPNTEKRSNQGEGLGLRYGLSSMQGWRSEMEDAHDVQIGLKYGLDDWSYFAVFDGHAGKRAAAFAAWNLLEFILRDNHFKLDTDNLPEHVYLEPDLDKIQQVVKVDSTSATSTSSCDEEGGSSSGGSPDKLPVEEKQSNGEEETKSLEENNQDDAKSDAKLSAGEEPTQSSTAQPNALSSTTSSDDQPNKPNEDDASKDKEAATTVEIEAEPVSKFVNLPALEQIETVKNAIRSGFLRIDQSMRDSAQDMSGCTAVCALVSPTQIFIANCGDSRAVLYDGKVALFATEDHKPLNPKERTRIIKAGGYATQRINGTLAVSRALGDFEFKKDQLRGPCEQLVSPEPEITVIERHPEHTFLVLACDGIWDVMDNGPLCEFIEYKLKVEQNLEDVCSAVLDACLHKGSRDNMSIIIVVFENGPKFSEEERARDLENDEKLKRYIRKLCKRKRIAVLTGADKVSYRLLSGLKNALSDERFRKKIGIYLPPGLGVIGKHELIETAYHQNIVPPSSWSEDDSSDDECYDHLRDNSDYD